MSPDRTRKNPGHENGKEPSPGPSRVRLADPSQLPERFFNTVTFFSAFPCPGSPGENDAEEGTPTRRVIPWSLILPPLHLGDDPRE